MADLDLLEIFDAPEVAVLADRAQVEAGHAEGLRPNLGVPAVKSPEVEIGGAIWQATRLDRIVIFDEEQEDVAVRGIERGRVTADLDIGIVDPGRPVEHARYLPARVTRAIARDALHRLDQLVIMDPAIVGAGDRAQLGAAVFGLEGFHLFAAVIG